MGLNLRQWRQSRPFLGRRLLTDRRGATAVMFAVTSIALAGLVGLGAEAGNWYVMKRAGQNAADAAAIAGPLTLGTASGASGCTASLQTTAATSGTSVASANGFTSGSGGATVTVQAPPWNGSYTGHPCAAEAQIAQVIPTVFASVIPGVASSMTVNNAAVAELMKLTPSCALALNQIKMNGASTTVTGTNCGFEANSTASDALQLNGNNPLTGTALATPGGCTGTVCSNLITKAPPGVNPFTAIYNPSTNTGLSFSTLPCVTSGTGNITVSGNNVTWTTASAISPSWTGSSEKAYCGGNGNGATLTVDNNHTPLTFLPGTYIFSNISLKFTGGTINCPTCTCPGTNCTGVTIILTGPSASKIGTLTVTAAPPSPSRPRIQIAQAPHSIPCCSTWTTTPPTATATATHRCRSRAAAVPCCGAACISPASRQIGGATATPHRPARKSLARTLHSVATPP